MSRILVPSKGIVSWQELLADPRLHWKRKHSAMELAISWELAEQTPRGLPAEVAAVLDLHQVTRGARLTFGIPEHQTDLPGGRRPSQTDLWAVLSVEQYLVSLAVEGKAGEPFGPTVGDWLKEASVGKRARLSALYETLALVNELDPSIRYQLLHRAASAVIEGRRMGAKAAVLLVQNFLPDSDSYVDYQSFVAQFGAVSCRNGICSASPAPDIELLFAWVDSPAATDYELARASTSIKSPIHEMKK